MKQIKLTIMKKYFTLIIVLIACISRCLSMEMTSIDSEKVSFEQIMRKEYEHKDFERTLNYMIDARYYGESNLIELDLYNIGIAHIYITDLLGNVTNYTITDTNTYTHVTLSTEFTNGNFYVVVDSEYVYAEGYVHK